MTKLLPSCRPSFCSLSVARRGVWAGVLLVTLGLAACHRHGGKHSSKPGGKGAPAAASPTPALPEFAVQAVATHEGDAYWYKVPKESLAQRRAWAEEMTAASDTLPLGTYVRVRRADEPGSAGVVLRITDDHIGQTGALIDVDHRAARQLHILESGKTRVTVETLALQNADADKPVDRRTDPVAPKTSELTSTPAVDGRTEREAAEAKAGETGKP